MEAWDKPERSVWPCLRSWDIFLVPWSALSPPRVLSPVYLANSIETIGRCAVNISVFSALSYFQATLYHAFWSSVWADGPSKLNVCIHLKLCAACVLWASLLLFNTLCCCYSAPLSCSVTILIRRIHCRHMFYILIMTRGCKLLWQVYVQWMLWNGADYAPSGSRAGLLKTI